MAKPKNDKILDGRMKAFLCASEQRRQVFDNYYEELKKIVDSDIGISPDDALFLLEHHVFMFPIVKEIMEWQKPTDEMTVLLDNTIDALRRT